MKSFFKNKKNLPEKVISKQERRIRTVCISNSVTFEMQAEETFKKSFDARSDIEMAFVQSADNEIFSHFEEKNFFDFWDNGLTVLKKYQADVLLFLNFDEANVKIYFQTPKMYQRFDIPFFSAMNHLSLPLSYFEQHALPEQISALIRGILIALTYIKEESFEKKLSEILDLLSKTKTPDGIKAENLASVFNFLVLLYVANNRQALSEKETKLLLGLMQTAFKNTKPDDTIMLGNLNAALGQVYTRAAFFEKANTPLLLEYALKSIRKARKYFNRYVFVYDYGRLSLVLSELYFKLYTLGDDNQTLRDAILCLKQARQIFTLSGQPFLWALIEDKLAKCLSLLSAKSNNKEIAYLAVESLKGKQKVYSKDYAPDMWAQTELEIGAIYDHLGQKLKDRSLLEEAFECYGRAYDIFAQLKQAPKEKELEKMMLRLKDALDRLDD